MSLYCSAALSSAAAAADLIASNIRFWRSDDQTLHTVPGVESWAESFHICSSHSIISMTNLNSQLLEQTWNLSDSLWHVHVKEVHNELRVVKFTR